MEQWDFYAEAEDAEPRFQVPWHNWQRYGEILLSDDRGDSGHTGVAVLDEVPGGAFTDPEPIDWDGLVGGEE